MQKTMISFQPWYQPDQPCAVEKHGHVYLIMQNRSNVIHNDTGGIGFWHEDDAHAALAQLLQGKTS